MVARMVSKTRVFWATNTTVAAPADSDPLFREGMGVAIMAKPLYINLEMSRNECRKVDIRLPGKGNSNSRGARPVF